jgi:hypothetical protein
LVIEVWEKIKKGEKYEFLKILFEKNEGEGSE